jgi:hypothetical protein
VRNKDKPNYFLNDRNWAHNGYFAKNNSQNKLEVIFYFHVGAKKIIFDQIYLFL